MTGRTVGLGTEGTLDQVFGRPPGQNDNEKRVSPTDLLALPATQLKVMRVMLRYNELSYKVLVDGFSRMPEGERLIKAELDAALEALVKSKWLVEIDDWRETRFRIGQIERTAALKDDNAEASAGASKTQQNRRQGSMDRLNSFWDIIGPDKPAKPTVPRDQPREVQRKPRASSLFDELSGSTPAPDPASTANQLKQKGWVSSIFDELSAKPSLKKSDDEGDPGKTDNT